MKRKQNQPALLHPAPFFGSFQTQLWGHFENRNCYPDSECWREKEDPGQIQKEINSLGKFAVLIGSEQEKCINLQ